MGALRRRHRDRHARNLAVAASGEAVIAVGGSFGTIAEMAFALRLGRLVVALDAPALAGTRVVSTPAEAVALVRDALPVAPAA